MFGLNSGGCTHGECGTSSSIFWFHGTVEKRTEPKEPKREWNQ